MYQGTHQASIEKIESSETWLDGSGYVSGGIEKNPKNLDKRVLRGIKQLLSLLSN